MGNMSLGYISVVGFFWEEKGFFFLSQQKLWLQELVLLNWLFSHTMPWALWSRSCACTNRTVTLVSVLSESLVKVKQLLKGWVILTDGTNVHFHKGKHFGNIPFSIMMNQLRSYLPCSAFWHFHQQHPWVTILHGYKHKHLFKINN